MRITFLILSLLSSFFINAQEQTSRLQYNIIVESGPIDDDITTAFEIQDLDDKSKSKSIKSQQELIAFLFADLAQLPKNKRQVLFYIHGMWGGKKFAFDRTYKMIENLYVNSPDSDIGRIVSIKWPGNKMEYKVNKKKLYQIDQQVTALFQEFFDNFYINKYMSQLTNVDLDMIAHSLGTELIKEVICQLPHGYYTSPIIDQLILASPDLATDVFEKEPCFGKHLDLVNHVTVYFSDRDLTLNVSNNLNKHDRLGRAGPSLNSQIPSNVSFVETTQVKDETNFSDLMTGHSSFRASPIVTKDILSVLTRNISLRTVQRKVSNPEQNVLLLEVD